MKVGRVMTDADVRPRNREKTELALREAFDRLCRTDDKPTIAAVAREVGVSPALLHNRYSTIAEEIRQLAGKQPRDELARLAAKLKDAQTVCKDLRTENEDLASHLRALASVNEGLRQQLLIEQAKNSGKVVSIADRTPSLKE
jgi:transposase-like protein